MIYSSENRERFIRPSPECDGRYTKLEGIQELRLRHLGLRFETGNFEIPSRMGIEMSSQEATNIYNHISKANLPKGCVLEGRGKSGQTL